MSGPLTGRIALVAGATRGAGRGTAVALGEAGATVYCTGRTTREHRSEYDRPETIEETAELVREAGGAGIAVAVDHLEPEQVRALVERIDAEQGRLDVLVNDVWGGEANWREGDRGSPHFREISESPRFVGRAVAALAGDPDVARHNGGSYSSGGLAREYDFTDVDGSQPDCWRYLVEVQDPGLEPDATGYR